MPKDTDVLRQGSDLQAGQTTAVRMLAPHASDTFRLVVDSAMLVYGNANQISLDAVVDVFDPAGKKIRNFDSPSRGPELYSFITSKQGVYKLVVSPFEDQTGEYTVTVSGVEPVGTTAEAVADQFVKAALGTDHPDGPGATVAVWKDGKITFSKGYGYADLESQRKNTPATIFHVASVSKQFTAFAIAMLADQGKLSLSDDIRKYLPEIHDFGYPITINHLVHHTSGLRDQWNLLMMAGWRLDDVITMDQIMRLISKQRELNFKPGDEHLYCNTGFTLMAEIVKRVTGQTLAQWSQANVFEPLEMRNTLFYDDHEKVVLNRAYSYRRGSQSSEYKKSVLSYANAGATSLFTTVEDISKWAMNFETMKVGNANVMALMQQRFVLNRGDTIRYALGQVIDKYKGVPTAGHGGADAGYRTYLLRFPEQHLGIAVFSNLGQFDPGSMTYAMADVLLADQFEPEKPGAPPLPEPEKKPFDPKTVVLADFTGRYYSDELETRYTFDIRNDTLTSHHQRHNDFKLQATAADTFSMEFLGTLAFTRDAKGKVNGFKASNGRVRNLVFRKE
jgi:CubicO group peptidase (beta-lactamase class C family)